MEIIICKFRRKMKIREKVSHLEITPLINRQARMQT